MTAVNLPIYLIDDEPTILRSLQQLLQIEGHIVETFSDARDAIRKLDPDFGGVVITDINMPGMDGVAFLREALKLDPELSIVMLTGHGDITTAVESMRLGAYDFIEKPFNIDQLLVVIRRAMETSKLRRENSALKRGETRVGEMLGQSATFRNLKSQLDKVTKSNGRVMLTGPAGSGKEMAARYIHAHSNRSDGPFVTVACAAIAPDQMEVVLFGRESPERGVEQGLLEQANGGVLLLDEVADMPLGTQSKILRVLVDQAFTRVGGASKVHVDLRVISSTNRNLEAEIEALLPVGFAHGDRYSYHHMRTIERYC